MFNHTRSLVILPAIVGHIADTDMLRRMAPVETGDTIADLIRNFREPLIQPLVRDTVLSDLAAMSENAAGFPALEADERISFLEAWNRIPEMAADGTVDWEDVDELIGPVVAMIESELVHIGNAGKQSRGEILPRHLERAFDREVAEGRIAMAEEDLKEALRTGTSRGNHGGHPTTRENPGDARILLEAGRPVLEMRPPGQKKWNRAEIREADPSRRPEDDGDMEFAL